MWGMDLARRRLRRACSGRREGGERAAPAAPLLLIADHSNYQSVARCCWRSLEAGARPGMTLAHARALLPGAMVEEHDAVTDREAMRKLAEWCATRYAPIVSPDPWALPVVNHRGKAGALPPHHPEFCPDGLVMDITGCARLFRGEERLGFQVVSALRRLGVEARVGIAPTIGAAWAAARFGESRSPIRIIGAGADLRGALSGLPIAALRIDPEAERALIELGVERVGQLLGLPRSALPSRFGAELLLRIDQALGQAIETIEPVRPAPPVRVERKLDGPTTQQEAVEGCTRELLTDLCRVLLARESAARVVEARFERVGPNGRGVELATQRVVLSRPTRSARHLWSLLRPRVERLHLGFGVEGIALVAVRTARARHEQMVCGEERHRPPGSEASRHQEEARLIDTLTNRLGEARVVRAEAVESHIPERTWRMVPAVREVPPGARRNVAGRGRLSMRERRARGAAGAPPAHPASRPPILFETPEPAEGFALRDRPPSALRWRGREVRITAGIGPERVASEWWRQGGR
ncbi:MAG: DNA polymerase Y family protein, partial [Phycisphaerales bacterium]